MQFDFTSYLVLSKKNAIISHFSVDVSIPKLLADFF